MHEYNSTDAIFVVYRYPPVYTLQIYLKYKYQFTYQLLQIEHGNKALTVPLLVLDKYI